MNSLARFLSLFFSLLSSFLPLPFVFKKHTAIIVIIIIIIFMCLFNVCLVFARSIYVLFYPLENDEKRSIKFPIHLSLHNHLHLINFKTIKSSFSFSIYNLHTSAISLMNSYSTSQQVTSGRKSL
jgi:hypothetical protein